VQKYRYYNLYEIFKNKENNFMDTLVFDYTNAGNDAVKKIKDYKDKAILANKSLHKGDGKGNDFLGWLDPSKIISKSEVEDIIKTAEKIRNNSDAFISIGIGGSYLGAKAVTDIFSSAFENQLPKDIRKSPEIYFAGQNISSTYLSNLIEIIQYKNLTLNIISKSGTTTEPALAFRVLRKLMYKKYNNEKLKERIIATTDREKGTLKKLADEEGFKSFVIPDDVGGRYSVLTPVGLLPIAVKGIDIKELLEGAESMAEKCKSNEPEKNPAMMYAILRQILYNNGKKIEILVNYEPFLHNISEWWKQLYGESEGKEHKGIFPASCDFTTDLHSMGQYIQEGERTLFETVLNVVNVPIPKEIERDPEADDGLNYLEGKDLSYVNDMARQGVSEAHYDGGVPNLGINLPEISPYYIGQLIYFFEKACAISGYMMNINPFNQPGVEAYKKNMFALLGKKGFEEEGDKLKEKINNKKKLIIK
jgi:glucose-6-phosphate isomerase